MKETLEMQETPKNRGAAVAGILLALLCWLWVYGAYTVLKIIWEALK